MNPLRDNPVLRSMTRRCWPKEQHASMGKAEAHLRAMKRRDERLRDSDTLRAYRCRHCGYYHTGHDRSQEKGATS
jgi:rubrerythrin